MSLYTIEFRPSEMDSFDDKYYVWNATLGGYSFDEPDFVSDPTQKAIIPPMNGKYRMTGMIQGSVPAGKVVEIWANVPPAHLQQDNHEPDYSGVGGRQTSAGGYILMPFCGFYLVNNNNSISFYFSKTFGNNDPTGTIEIGLISPQ